MLFGKLLPREGNFFEMFNQHADRIVETARAFSQLVANYNDAHLREQYNRERSRAYCDSLRPSSIWYSK